MKRKKLKLEELNVTSFITSEAADNIRGASGAPLCVNTFNNSNLPVCATDQLDCLHATTQSQLTDCGVVCLNPRNTLLHCI